MSKSKCQLLHIPSVALHSDNQFNSQTLLLGSLGQCVVWGGCLDACVLGLRKGGDLCGRHPRGLGATLSMQEGLVAL